MGAAERWWRRSGKEGVLENKQRAGTQVGCPGMFEHSREKALLEFKVKNFPANTWSAGQIRTNEIKRNMQIKVQVSIEALRPLFALQA